MSVSDARLDKLMGSITGDCDVRYSITAGVYSILYSSLSPIPGRISQC